MVHSHGQVGDVMLTAAGSKAIVTALVPSVEAERFELGTCEGTVLARARSNSMGTSLLVTTMCGSTVTSSTDAGEAPRDLSGHLASWRQDHRNRTQWAVCKANVPS
jgi:hypothetical protein